MDCRDIQPAWGEVGTPLAEALGFGVRGSLNFRTIEVTKAAGVVVEKK